MHNRFHKVNENVRTSPLKVNKIDNIQMQQTAQGDRERQTYTQGQQDRQNIETQQAAQAAREQAKIGAQAHRTVQTLLHRVL